MKAIDRIEFALEAKGCKPRRNGSHINSLCPAHDDHQPSLSVDQADNKVLLNCFAGCAIENIVSALQLNLADLFDNENIQFVKDECATEETYDYCDEQWTLLYQVVRYWPKKFVQRRPDNAGGWIWNLKDVRRVPYRLPELIAGVESGHPIIIVEGEKDVDRLIKEGFVATCNSNGAGNFLPEFSRYFLGARVVILPDNDRAGRDHARRVAAILKGVAAEIRVVELPNLEDRGDVSDWLETCGDANQLMALIDGTEPLGAKRNEVVPSDTSVLTTGELLETVRGVLNRFVVFPNDHQVVALTLWVLHTHVFDAFDTTPYIAVSSPTKQAGKTRLFEVLHALVARPFSIIEATGPTLFRKIAKSTPTLLLDEIDAAFGKDVKLTEGIRSILNAGFRRGAVVARCDGPKHELKEFPVYCPKAFAGIGDKLPDTVRDRSIPIELRRRGASDPKPDRLRRADINLYLLPIGAQIAKWGLANQDSLADLDLKYPRELSDRQQDAWEPLFAIAESGGGEWPSAARKAAIALHGGVFDTDVSVLLLDHIREIFNEKHVDTLSTKVILEALTARGDDSPWASSWGTDVDFKRIKGPASHLARMLKPFGIAPKSIRFSGQGTDKGYRRADFVDPWARYLRPDRLFSTYPSENNETMEQPRSELLSGQIESKAKSTSDQDCYVVTSPSEAESIEDCNGVFVAASEDRCLVCGELVIPAISSAARESENVCPHCSTADL